MKTFTVRDLREHTGALIGGAEEGRVSLITKHGRPVFLAVPFNEDLLHLGLRPLMALLLFKEGALSLAKAAKLAGQSLEGFIEKLGSLGVVSVNYEPMDLEKEIKDFG